MTDSATETADWIATWIARQRELLEQRAAAAAAQPGQADFEEMSQQWAALGQLFTNAWTSGLGSSGWGWPSDPFNVSETILSAWNAASFMRSSFAEQTAETLRRLPPIGLAREHTEAWRELATAHAECRRIEQALQALLIRVQVDALDLLQKRVTERDPSEPIKTFRVLYDMWVDCGEHVYGQLAHSEAYSKLQADLGNASMRLRARVQTVLEQGLKQFDLPTRSELNSLHRQVRDLRLQIEQLQSAPVRATTKSTVKKSKAKGRKR